MSPSKYHENYPPDWPAIAQLVKQANGYICQMCGQQCTRPGEPYDRRRILTVAHLDHDYDSPEIFVACICILCHFDFDRGLGQRFRRRNERWRRARAGQLVWVFMFAGTPWVPSDSSTTDLLAAEHEKEWSE